MQFHELTDEQRRSFHENGYLVVPGALDGGTVAKRGAFVPSITREPIPPYIVQPMDWRVMPDHVVEQVKGDPIAMQLIGRTGNPGGKFRPGTETRPLQEWADEHGVDYHQYHSTGGAAVGVRGATTCGARRRAAGAGRAGS